MRQENIRPIQEPAESGQIIILMAVFLVLLLLIVAVLIDIGTVLNDRRQAQGAADTVALTAASALCNGQDPVAAGLIMAANNGFFNDGIEDSITINNPPLSGPYTGDNSYVTVELTAVTHTSFAQIFYSGEPKNTVRATTACRKGGWGNPAAGTAVLALNKNAVQSLKRIGNGTTRVENGGIFVNSDHENALFRNGKSVLAADWISIVGGYNNNAEKNLLTPSLNTGVPRIEDPFLGLAAPADPGGSCLQIKLNGGDSITLDPGRYCGIDANTTGSLNLNPGIYYIDSGGFTINGQTQVNAEHVLLYLAPDGGEFKLNGSGEIHISGPSEGDYRGLALYMDRKNSSSVFIAGNAALTNLAGTFYAPASTITTAGTSGTALLNTQVIADKIIFDGDAEIRIIYDENHLYLTNLPSKISLIE